MFIRLISLAFLLALQGCSTVEKPASSGEYFISGPRATIQDSVTTRSESKAEVFAAEKLNGSSIDNSIDLTIRASRGRGFSIATAALSRPVPAGSTIKVVLKGRTMFAAPIQALTNPVYQVTGEIEFVPAANATYEVRGQLSEGYSAVWIEDAATKEVVGKKIEIGSPAKPGSLGG